MNTRRRWLKALLLIVISACADSATDVSNHAEHVRRNALVPGSWSAFADLPFARAGGGTAVVGDALYVVAGGGDEYPRMVLAYDATLDAWTQKADMLTDHSYPAVGSVGSTVYVAGGCGPNGDCVNTINTFESYDANTNTWSTLPPMPSPRFAPGAAVAGGKFWVFGGRYFDGGYHESGAVESFDPASGVWTTYPNMPNPRIEPASVELNGLIYVIGGGNNIGPLPTFETFNPVTHVWTQLPPMPTATYGHGAVAAGGRIYVIAGIVYDAATGGLVGSNSVMVYDPASGGWSEGPSIPTRRYGSRPQVIGTTIFVAGTGAANQGSTSLEGFEFEIADVSPPVITADVSGTLGTNGWYKSPVTVTFSVSDAQSAVTSAPCLPQTEEADVVSQSFSCTATSAGGSVTKTETFKKDGTAPGLSFTGSSNYTVDQAVSIGCTASDALSGIASTSCSRPLASGPASSFALGGHTVLASATDVAGNSVSASFTFTISVNTASLGNLVRAWVTVTSVAGSLNVKLENAQASAARGNMTAMRNQIAAFINQVEAQTGKSIPADKAALLIAFANALL